MYFIIPHMYFRVNMKMKKLRSCCCFTWIVFIKLNFAVALLLIRKTWRILRNGGDPCNGGMILKWGVDTPLRTMQLVAFVL